MAILTINIRGWEGFIGPPNADKVDAAKKAADTSEQIQVTG